MIYCMILFIHQPINSFYLKKIKNKEAKKKKKKKTIKNYKKKKRSHYTLIKVEKNKNKKKI